MKDLAARAGDPLGHGGTLATGSANVFVKTQPFARAGKDYGRCGRRVAEGSKTVLVNGKPAARDGSRLVCASKVIEGELSVWVGGPNQLVLPITGGHGSKGGTAPKDAPGSADGGHPVDVATGVMWTAQVDFVLPGPMPFAWRRLYQSSAAGLDTGMGHGWRHLEEWSAQREGDQLEVTTPQGRSYAVPFPEPGQWQQLLYGRRIARRGETLIVAGAGDEHHRLLERQGDGIYRVTTIVRTQGAYANLFWQDGELSAVIDSAGRLARRRTEGREHIWEAFARDEHGQVHHRPLVRYLRDERGDLVRVVEASGAQWELSYDEAHRLVAETRPDGLTYRFRYEAEGDDHRCVETWGELSDRSIMAELGWTSARPDCRGVFHTTFVYGDDRTTMTDAEGGLHIFDANGFGMVTRYRDPEGYVQTYRYDAEANMVGHTDRAGRTTRFERDEDGRLLRFVEPGDRVTSLDVQDEQTVVTQPNGRTWTMAYAAGQLSRRTDPSGATEAFLCDGRGLPTVRAFAGGEQRAVYDSAGNLTSWRDERGATGTFAYDGFGRLLRHTNRNGQAQHYRHDEAGRLVGVEDAMGRIMGILRDVMGHATTLEHPGGGVSSSRYVGDVLVERITADGARWRMGYDALQRLRWIEAPSGERHEVDYDGIDRCVRETSFAGVTRSHRHNARGQLVRTVRQDGSLQERSYDDLGRLICVQSGETRCELGYDDSGALVTVRQDSSLVELERDARGRVIRERQRVGDHGFEVSLERDINGQVVAHRYSTGWSVELARDARGNVAELSVHGDGQRQAALGFDRDGEGHEVSRRSADGVVVDTSRDPRGRPTAIAVHRSGAGPGEPTHLRRYVWDDRGPLARVEDSAGGTRRYELDAVGRARRVRGLGTDETLAYSRLGAPMPVGSGCEVGRGGRPLRQDGRTTQWDELGRLSERHDERTGRRWRYHYDGFDQLVCVEREDGRRKTYRYDGLGRRVVERCGDHVTTFGWDGESAVEESSAAGQVRRVFADDGYTPLLERLHQAWRQVVTDGAATPWLYLSAEHSAAIELSTTGAVVREAGGAGSLRFAGQRHDDFAGLCYQRFRHYSPDLGTFTTPDPIGLQGSVFDIGFVPNATGYVDPLGLRTVILVGGEKGGKGYMDNLAAFHSSTHGHADVIDAADLVAGKASLSDVDLLIVDAHGASLKDANGFVTENRVVVNDYLGDHPSYGDTLSGEELGGAIENAGFKPGGQIKMYTCNAGDAGSAAPAPADSIAQVTQSTVEAAKSSPTLLDHFSVEPSWVGDAVKDDWVGLSVFERTPGGLSEVGILQPGTFGPNDVGKLISTGNAGMTTTFGSNFTDLYIPLGDWQTFTGATPH